MPSLALPFHSYRLDSQQASNARLVNCYAEQAAQPAKGPVYLKLAPGIYSYLTAGSGAGRGAHVFGDAVYTVFGTTLYKVQGGTATNVGTIAGTGRAFMTANTTQLVISVPGVAGYVYDGTTLAQITDADFTSRSAGACDFLDNFILFVDEGSGRVFCSSLADATSYDALDFATAEVAPDNLVTLVTNQQELVLLGTTSGERWYNAGGTGFPFARIPGGSFELGCIAKHSAFTIDNTCGFLASDLTVRMIRGAVPQRVSQHGVEAALRSYSRVDDCEASTYTFGGHLFVVLRFPAAGACWVYDVTTNEWHERETYGTDGWDVADVVTLNGTVYAQRASTGDIGIITDDVFTEWGNTLRWEATFQGVQAKGATRMFHSRLQLLGQVGQGLPTGQGSDPIVTLEVSNDGGETFFALPTRSFGLMGHYRERVQWHGLGSARDRVYRISGSDPVPMTLWGAWLDAVAGVA